MSVVQTRQPSQSRPHGGPWNRHRHRRDAPRVAALDLGTSNCRLLIARPVAKGFKVVDGYSRIVRLGEGLNASGELSRAAMERTIEALKVCADKVNRRGVVRARYVGTEACRQAANGDAFCDLVARETGIDLEIIPSREEAELTLAGCVPLFDPEIPYGLMFDVGGGSAEILWLKLDQNRAPETIGWVSLPCGVVTLTERHGKTEFSDDEYEALIEEVSDMLRPFDAQHGIGTAIAEGKVQMLGTAGTVTTITGVDLGLERYNRTVVDGSWLDFEVVREVSQMLMKSTVDERAAHACIGTARAELVVAGCAVLEAVCRVWPAGQLRVADRGVREGILLALVDEVNRGNPPQGGR